MSENKDSVDWLRMMAKLYVNWTNTNRGLNKAAAEIERLRKIAQPALPELTTKDWARLAKLALNSSVIVNHTVTDKCNEELRRILKARTGE